MIKFLTLRQFICPLSLFLKEIPFASLTNAIDVKIEKVLTGFLIGGTICFRLKGHLASQNDSFTHGKVCTQMGSGHPSVYTTSDFHAVLFWFGSCMIPQQFGGLH